MFSVLRAAASRLGLVLRPSEPSWRSAEIELSGSVGVHAVAIRSLPGEGLLETLAFLSPALDCGLDIKPVGHAPHAGRPTLRRLGRFYGAADLHQPDFADRDAFEVHGDEEPRVRALLEPLRPLLSPLHQHQVPFHVTDALVSIRRFCSEGPIEEEQVLGDVQRAVAIATTIDAGRASLSPAAGVANHVADFHAFARNADDGNGGSLSTPLAAWARLRGRTARVWSVRRALHVFVIESSLDLGVPLDPSMGPVPTLSCRAERAPPASFATRIFGRSRVESKTFESVFGFHSHDVVPQRAQDALSRLHASGHAVELDGHGIRMSRSAEEDEISLEESFDVASEVLDAVERASQNRRPYR